MDGRDRGHPPRSSHRLVRSVASVARTRAFTHKTVLMPILSKTAGPSHGHMASSWRMLRQCWTGTPMLGLTRKRNGDDRAVLARPLSRSYALAMLARCSVM